jgi:hypothetical protein
VATNKKVNVILGAVDRTAPAFRSVTSSLRGVTTGQAAMAAGAIAAAAAMVGAVKVIAGVVNEMADAGDRLDKMSQRLGVSTEDLSKWEYAIRLGGGSADTYEKAVKKLNQTIYDAGQGLATYTRLFDDLGVEYKNADGSMRSSTDVLLDMSDALNKVENQSKRNAIASKMMGRGGADMLPVLQQGSAALREQFDELQRLGGVYSTEFTKDSAAFVDSELRMEVAWKGLKRAVAEPFLEPATDAINWIAGAIATVSGNASTAADEIDGMAGAIDRWRESAMRAQGVVGFGGAGVMTPEDIPEHLRQKTPDVEIPKVSAPPVMPPPAAAPYKTGQDVYTQMMMEQQRIASGPDVSPQSVARVEDALGMLPDAFADLDDDAAQVEDRLGDIETAGVSAAQQIGAQFAEQFAMMMVQGGDVEDMFNNLLKSALSMGLSLGIRSAFGLPLPFAAGGTVPKAAVGYSVPDGPRGLDSRMILAMPGEEVVSRKLSQRLDRYLGMAEVGDIGQSGGGGSITVQNIMQRPQTRRDWVNFNRDSMRAVEDGKKAVY